MRVFAKRRYGFARMNNYIFRGNNMKKPLAKRALLCVAAVALVAMSSLPASAGGGHGYGPHTEEFRLIYPLTTIPWYPAEKMIENCGGTYEYAKARITYEQRHGKTYVHLRVNNTAPNTLWTVWLGLDGGSVSPLTDLGITALANTSEVDALAAATPSWRLNQTANDLGLTGDDGTGSQHVANGFWTDRHGYGEFRVKLDFPLNKGAYQWREYDASLPRSAIGGGAFKLRIVSHCVDQTGHGLTPGIPGEVNKFHEMWFDW